MKKQAHVLVLAGGPDAERDISIESGTAVASALSQAGHRVEYREINRVDVDELRSMPGEVVFPVLHGVWGEGGPLQSVLESNGRPYIGSGPVPARIAMDKLATKIQAGRLGIPTPLAGVVSIDDDESCIPLPAVVKPVHEGSSVGLTMCHSAADWASAIESIRSDTTPGRVYMAESMVRGRELTVGLIEDGEGGFLDLPVIEIVSSSGVYDYEAKYIRGDTEYVVGPDIPSEFTLAVKASAVRLAREIGVRHLGRVDFLLDEAGGVWLLEVNTMPGFTASSLLPKAASAIGITLPQFVSQLVALADRTVIAG